MANPKTNVDANLFAVKEYVYVVHVVGVVPLWSASEPPVVPEQLIAEIKRNNQMMFARISTYKRLLL